MYSEREKNRIKSEKLVPKNVYKLAPEYITEHIKKVFPNYYR